MCVGDLAQDTGLSAAVAGMDAIIHCASNFREEQPQTDIKGTRALVQAALTHEKPHLVYISIVGVDHSTYRYYRAKRAAEALIEEGPLPWKIVRTTQFHDLVWKLLQSFGYDISASLLCRFAQDKHGMRNHGRGNTMSLQLYMIGLAVQDMDKSREFYRRLGLALPEENPKGPPQFIKMEGTFSFFLAPLLIESEKAVPGQAPENYRVLFEYFLKTQVAL